LIQRRRNKEKKDCEIRERERRKKENEKKEQENDEKEEKKNMKELQKDDEKEKMAMKKKRMEGVMVDDEIVAAGEKITEEATFVGGGGRGSGERRVFRY